MSPKVSIARSARSGDSAEPDSAITRSESRFRFSMSSVSSSTRDSRIGTVISTSAACSSIARRVNFASVLRAVTIVLPRPSASIELSSPQAWKPGEDSTTVRPERSGIFDRYPPGSASDNAISRGAPFGVPVVPLVSRMIFCFDPGRGGRPSLPLRIRPSTVSASMSSMSPDSTASVQATYLPPDGSTDSATLPNSSSWISAVTSSRSHTSASCGPAKSVLSSSVRAPSFAPAMIASKR